MVELRRLNKKKATLSRCIGKQRTMHPGPRLSCAFRQRPPSRYLQQTLVEDLLLSSVEAEVFGSAEYGDDQAGSVRVTHLPVVHQKRQHLRYLSCVRHAHVLARLARTGVFVYKLHLSTRRNVASHGRHLLTFYFKENILDQREFLVELR